MTTTRYRAFLTTETSVPDQIEATVREVAGRLVGVDLESVSDRDDVVRSLPSKGGVMIAHADRPDQRLFGIRFQWQAGNDDRTWVDILACTQASQGRSNIVIDSWQGDIPIAGKAEAIVSELVARLADQLASRDAGLPQVGQHHAAELDDGAEVAVTIASPDRRGAVLCAAGGEFAIEEVSTWVSALARRTSGCSISVSLDGDAVAGLSKSLDPGFAPPTEGVAVYLPGVRADGDLGSAARRLVSVAAIRQFGDQLSDELTMRIRESSAAIPVPADLELGLRELARKLDLAPFKGWRKAQRPRRFRPVRGVATSGREAFESEPDEPCEAAMSEIGRYLGFAMRPVELKRFVEDGRTADVLIEGVIEENSALRQAAANSQELAGQLTERLAESETEKAELQRRIESLTDQLNSVVLAEAAADVGALTHHVSEGEPEVRSFDALLERVASLRYVVFSGDPKVTVGLNRNQQAPVWAEKSWSAIRALEDYADLKQAGEFEGGMREYVKHTPPGRHCCMNIGHGGESDSVKGNAKWRSQRLLPGKDGTLEYMWAHFKIGEHTVIRPRLHYIDHTDEDGRIYIGYLGPHLLNRQTN